MKFAIVADILRGAKEVCCDIGFSRNFQPVLTGIAFGFIIPYTRSFHENKRFCG